MIEIKLDICKFDLYVSIAKIRIDSYYEAQVIDS